MLFFAGEDDCDECYCGFSAVINRKMSHMAGLFYEDEAEITSITEDAYASRKKPNTLLCLTSSNADTNNTENGQDQSSSADR